MFIPTKLNEMKKNILFALSTLCIATSFAQMPNTDIWLFDMKDEGGKIAFSNPANITNRVGYDNQPSFSPDGNSLYYTAMQNDNQTDIFSYNLKTKKTNQFTKTATSEYSPMFTPDGNFISVVMVEPDSAQRIWKFPIKAGAPELITEKVDSIGYYCWTGEDRLATFILTNPTSLQVFNLQMQKPLKVSANEEIGRSIQTHNNEELLFMTKSTTGNYIQICKTNFQSYFHLVSSDAIKIIGEGEDFIVYKNAILMCSTTEIYCYKFETKQWQKLDDFAKYGIKNITRIAVSGVSKKLAIVAE